MCHWVGIKLNLENTLKYSLKGVERVRQLFEIIKNTTKLDSDSEDIGITFQDLIEYFDKEEAENKDQVQPPSINITSIKDLDQYFAAAALTGANLSQDSITLIGQGESTNQNA